MSLLDAHIPQLVASEAAFAAKAALMRSTIAQAEQAAQSSQAFHMGESSAAFQAAHARFIEVVGQGQLAARHRAGQPRRRRRHLRRRGRRRGQHLHRHLNRRAD